MEFDLTQYYQYKLNTILVLTEIVKHIEFVGLEYLPDRLGLDESEVRNIVKDLVSKEYLNIDTDLMAVQATQQARDFINVMHERLMEV
jgi:helix-turn-helix protein